VSKRERSLTVTMRAGCNTCHSGQAFWLGRNAQAVAARHHDKTGHQTWVDASMLTTYGSREHHPDLFEGAKA